MKVEEKYKSISSKVFVLLPKKCIQCETMFRFEMGRKHVTIDMFGPKTGYLCRECVRINGIEKSDRIFELHIQSIKNNMNNLKNKMKLKWPPPGGSAIRPQNLQKTNTDYIKIIKE